MAELIPFPFEGLVARCFRELRERDAIFGLPKRRFFLGDPERDLSVAFHGKRASTPLGPAAGPQSQMAQNLVLSWLGGSRILELKTVQVNDRLQIPRPCIDMQTVGFNVEWSQELAVTASLDEAVKGALLIALLAHSGRLDLGAGFTETLFDVSVGYDLQGIKSDKVTGYLRGMLHAKEHVDRLRDLISVEASHLRDVPMPDRLSDTVTLSTFHGCPPGEIEQIAAHLMQEMGFHCIVKLNPMLLGPQETGELLHDLLGYEDLRVPASAFERDTTYNEAVDFLGRLSDLARREGRGFGIKLTNTLIVENHRNFFPSTEREMYLSGPPLHVLAMHLVKRFRETFGTALPISFSAGIERRNFPDAVALGLVPITVCSDLLKPGGYGRSRGYFEELQRRMSKVEAVTLSDFVERAYRPASAPSGGDPAETLLRNTTHYVNALTHDLYYRREQQSKVPKKIGRTLDLFDCITCDKCLPVCPNHANFTLPLPRKSLRVRHVIAKDDVLHVLDQGHLLIEQKHQIATFADFCNACGNCDVFCPEDGGPYVVKPHFFGSLASWTGAKEDGIFVGTTPAGTIAHVRHRSEAFSWSLDRFGLATLTIQRHVITETATGEIHVEPKPTQALDITWLDIMRTLVDALLSETSCEYASWLARQK